MSSPDLLFGDLFRDVQLSGLFPDSKTFVDCIPRQKPEAILAAYYAEGNQPDFDLATFVNRYFDRPSAAAFAYVSDTSLTTAAHIDRLWDVLTRTADTPVEYDSLIALPHPYVVPGGRFREIFYWDSYFTMLGLRESGRTDLIRAMLDNFAYLIDTVGFIPNGNRTYFLSRSQPPFFGLMVELLAEIEGPTVLATYLPQLQKEYTFWMDGSDALTAEKPAYKRVALAPDDQILNRYWDSLATPRPEAYKYESNLVTEADQHGIEPTAMHLHLRAACESGWDFSSRWLADGKTLVSTNTAEIVPVDLNCVLYSLEKTLEAAYRQAGNQAEAATFSQLAEQRKTALLATCWNDETGFFHDYHIPSASQTTALTLAGVFPLFMNLATPEQAARVHELLTSDFLQAGGWVTTLRPTGQQWDWPNGWAPLQWIVYQGLSNYGYTQTAREGGAKWLAHNDKVFKATGKMMEKYNVVEAAITTGGGKYPNQDGFGWTNGVYLALRKEHG